MKALSIRQPWAWGIIHAGKDVENRTWPTKVRGEFLIHAGQAFDKRDYSDFVETFCQASKVRPGHWPDLPQPKDLEFGGIVGIAEIVDCVRESSSPWFFGRWGFVIRNARPLPFRPFKGKLGFFDVPDLP